MSEHLPTNKEVRDLLEGLLGRDVSLNNSSSPCDPGADSVAVATFTCSQSDVHALCAMDIQLSASVSAALGLIPPAAASEMAKEGELNSTMIENLHEVMNIVSVLMNKDGGAHYKLADLYAPSVALPDSVRAEIPAQRHKLDLDIAVTGYGSGSFGLYLPDVS